MADDGELTKISILAPRAGSDLLAFYKGGIADLFQSSLPVRGATGGNLVIQFAAYHFNPRSPCGERHLGLDTVPLFDEFQSSLPVRGATAIYCDIVTKK